MHCLQSLLLVLSGSFALSLPSPSSISDPTSRDYSLCASFEYKCAGDHIPHEIYYPFLLKGVSEPFCGRPEYELSCTPDSGTMVARISGEEYQVKSIDYGYQLLQVTEPKLAGESCVQTFTNTTIDPSLFTYVDAGANLTVLFDCSPILPSFNYLNDILYDILYNITCPDSDSDHFTFYALTNDALTPEIWKMCNSSAVIPVDSSVVSNLKQADHANYAGTFTEALKEGFRLNWTAGDGWCGRCRASKGICWSDPGSRNSSGECYCVHGTSSNHGVCVSIKNHRSIMVGVGSAAGVGFLVACLSLVLYFYRYRKVPNGVLPKKNLNNNQKFEVFLEEYGSLTPKRYSYSNVKKITKAFREKLGQGGFGTVFKGTLDNGHMVAVKILSDSKGDGEEFINEVASIGRTSHVNVVSLLGFCYEGSKRALIYDFMCNGSLEKLLYSEVSKTSFDWERLYQIAIGIARGLEYLHRGCNTRIVHFDIKPHNILLDRDFCPKISDFGLAKLCLKKESIISIAGARGTIGYIAPEVFSRNFGVVSSKSDVYSYGMVVLEMAGGRKNPNEGVENSSERYFPHWIYAQLDQNGDLLTCGITAESEEIVRKMVLVGLWCIQTTPENRPSMSRVIEMMEGDVNDLQIPPKPHLSSTPLGSRVAASLVTDCSSPAHSLHLSSLSGADLQV